MCAQSAASTRESWRVDISRLLGELWRGAVGATGLGEERPDWRRDAASFAQEETLEIGGVAHMPPS